jgi:hypothetical protein
MAPIFEKLKINKNLVEPTTTKPRKKWPDTSIFEQLLALNSKGLKIKNSNFHTQ